MTSIVVVMDLCICSVDTHIQLLFRKFTGSNTLSIFLYLILPSVIFYNLVVRELVSYASNIPLSCLHDLRLTIPPY